MPLSFDANSAIANQAKVELFPEIQIAWAKNSDCHAFLAKHLAFFRRCCVPFISA